MRVCLTLAAVSCPSPPAWYSILKKVSAALFSSDESIGAVSRTTAEEKKAADLLGIPYEKYTQAGLFPIAYTKGTEFKPAKRLPAEQLTHWDTW